MLGFAQAALEVLVLLLDWDLVDQWQAAHAGPETLVVLTRARGIVGRKKQAEAGPEGHVVFVLGRVRKQVPAGDFFDDRFVPSRTGFDLRARHEAGASEPDEIAAVAADLWFQQPRVEVRTLGIVAHSGVERVEQRAFGGTRRPVEEEENSLKRGADEAISGRNT